MIRYALIALFCMGFSASGANLVTNGDFSVDCNGWTTSNTDGFFCQNGSGLGPGNPGGWADLNNGPGVSPSMSQTISSLVIGTQYLLSWDMQSAHHCCGDPINNGVGVMIDGVLHEYAIPNSQGWTPYSITFTYTGTSNVLEFSSQRNGTDTDAGFDNISLDAVRGAATPEPSSTILVAAGGLYFGISRLRKAARQIQ